MTASEQSSKVFSMSQHPIWDIKAKPIGGEPSFYIFFGYSGDSSTPSEFPNGEDINDMFKLTGQTLGRTLQLKNKDDIVQVIQAWKKDIIFSVLQRAKANSIKQVHIAIHGTTTWLSCAYHFGNRFMTRVATIDAMAGTSDQKALAALKDEDALTVGFISKVMDAAVKTKIKGNHKAGAHWQVWGCFAGYLSDTFNSDHETDDIGKYFDRFNFGAASVQGIAVEIATSFDVTCTGAQGSGGLEFWHGDKKKNVAVNDTKTPSKLPYWLWLTTPSTWHSFDKTGTETPKPFVLGEIKNAADLTKPKPPKWFTDLYY